MATAKELIQLNKADRKSIKAMSKEIQHTLHNIMVDGKTPKNYIALNIDKVITLSQSTLRGDLTRELDRLMVGYYNLPEGEQIRQLPDTSLKALREFMKGFKYMAEWDKSVNAGTKKLMNINDENDTTVHVISSEYFKDNDYIEADFPYTSIIEILNDNKLSGSEKQAMTDRYLEMKQRGETIIEPITAEITLDEVEELDDDITFPETDKETLAIIEKGRKMLEILMGDEETVAETFGITEEELASAQSEKLTWDTADDIDDITEEIVEPQKTETVKAMYDRLCKQFPKKFHPTKSGHVHWEHKYRGKEYTPILITADDFEFERIKEQCIYDSRIIFKTDGYFIPELDYSILFIRTTKE